MNNFTDKFKETGVVSFIRNKYGEILDVDSYKLSHSEVYSPNANWMMSYLESRGGLFKNTVWVGLQLLLLEYFSSTLTHDQIDNLKAFSLAHGEPFPEKQFRKVVDVYNGKFPVIIKSVDEGSVVPVSNVLLTIESSVDDHDVMSLVSYFETKLMRVWYPTTVATLAYNMKLIGLKHLSQTTENPNDYIGFFVNDFSNRGTTDLNGSIFGGIGHLANFMGSDNIPAVLATMEAYDSPSPVAFSIRATEHSIMSSQGKDGEELVFKRLLESWGDTSDMFACVADTYDIYNFCNVILANNKERILDMKAKLVVRPDSGVPNVMVIEVLEMLGNVFGTTINSKGYKVLNPKVSIIYGDGMSIDTIDEMFGVIVENGWCASNVVTGVGGKLAQDVNRDTQKFAIKCSSMKYDGEYKDVFKQPITASFKKSKAGRLVLLKDTDGKYITTTLEKWGEQYPHIEEQELKIRYKDGEFLNLTSFDEVRKNTGLW